MTKSQQDTDLEQLNELIDLHKKRLHKLQVRIALEGRNARPEDELEVERISQEIVDLKQRERDLSSGRMLGDEVDELRIIKEEIKGQVEQEFQVQAAFTNRQKELEDILGVSSKPFVFITAPAGYGKTHLVKEIKRRLDSKIPNKTKWLIVHYECKEDDTYPTVLEEMARQMGYKDMQAVRNLTRFLQFVKKAFKRETHQGLFLIFDEVEHWKFNDSRTIEWKAIAEWVQKNFVPGLNEVLERASYEFRVIFTGRYITSLNREFPLPHPLLSKSISLSSFDLDVTKVFIRDTLSRYESLDGNKLRYKTRDIEVFAEEILEVTGGHPRAIADLLQHIGETEGFNIALQNYFNSSRKREFFEKYVSERIQELLRDVPDSLKPIFEVLSVFRGFNNDTLSTLIDQDLISWDNQKDSWDLLKQISATHLIRITGPLSRDRILQRILDAKKKFLGATEYRELHGFAAKLYLCWLKGTDMKGEPLESGVPTGSDQIQFILEYLYHFCCSESKVTSKKLTSIVEQLMDQVQYPGGFKAGRCAMYQAVTEDEQLPRIMERSLGSKGYQSLLNYVLDF